MSDMSRSLTKRSSRAAMLEFVVIVVLVTGAVVAVGVSREPASPAALSDGEPFADPPAPALIERKSAPKAVAAARAQLATKADVEGGEMFPWLNPLPPLAGLARSGDSPELRMQAEKLIFWSITTVSVAVRSCWTRRPPKRVWAEFSAQLDRGDGPNDVKVSELRFVTFHGDFLLAPAEAACLSEKLSAISGRSGSSEEKVEALVPYFPLAHRIAFEIPCAACSQR